MEDCGSRIEEGVYWLDKNIPQWHLKVDTTTLDMASCTRCILGQVVGDYTDAMQEYNLSDSEVEEYGFEVMGASDLYNPATENYEELERCWIEEIEERL